MADEEFRTPYGSMPTDESEVQAPAVSAGGAAPPPEPMTAAGQQIQDVNEGSGFFNPDGTPIVPQGNYYGASGRGILGEPNDRPMVGIVEAGWEDDLGPVYERPSGGRAWRAGDALYHLQNMSPTQVKKIQRALAGAGAVESVNYGRIDQQTIDAFEDVMAVSNQNDIPLMNVLGRMAAGWRDYDLAAKQERAARNAGPVRAPFTARVSNAEELRQFFQNELVEMTGSGSTNVDIDRMVRNYQAEQRNAQARAYNAAPTGGVVEAEMSPDAYAEQQFREAAPVEMQANSAIERAGDLLGMLGTFGGQ